MEAKEIWQNKKRVNLSCSPIKTKNYGTRYIEFSEYERLKQENARLQVENTDLRTTIHNVTTN